MSEKPVGQAAVPGVDDRAIRARPHGSAAALQRPALQLEARTGGNVCTAVAVDVEWLTEAEAELTSWIGAGDAACDAPAGARRAAERGGLGRRAEAEDRKT